MAGSRGFLGFGFLDDPAHHFGRVDAFAAAGTGWGNTYQRRIPIHRIDQIHCTRQFRPLRCSAVTTRHSDHRMVVADLLPSS